MDKIILYIKKFFAMLISIIYGVFKKDKNIETSTKAIEKPSDESSKREKIIHQRIIQEDEKSEKSRDTFTKEEKQNKDIIYYAKRDIQRLLFIQKKLTQLENDIKKCTDLEEVYELEKEYQKAKVHFEKIVNYYEKIDLNVAIIKDIKNIIKDTDKLVKKNETQIKDKVYEIKKESKEEQEKIEEFEEEIDKKIGVQEEIKIPIEHEIEEEKQLEEKEIGEEELTKEENIEEKTEKQEEKVELENINILDEKIIEKEVEAKKENKIREMVVDASILSSTVNRIREQQNNTNVAAISAILAKAHALAANSNPNILLQLNTAVAVASTLYINNEIKRAKSLTGERVKKLTQNKVIEAVGINPKLQVRYIMTNSLTEIRRLKNELKKYGNAEEVLNALNELNELEMEILMQMNELQMQNNMQQGMHR